ncbi:dihydroorotate dehydrogenase [Hypomontagnella submonticulosa]|nr:dihydroorotate dehydrogenase [Hypomontagnella submonticulosa]
MQPPPPALNIDPPLLNSANPWATSLDDLRALFECPSTGAVTTRTALLGGFAHDPAVHQYAFFDPATHRAAASGEGPETPGNADAATSASLNNLGYSPVPLGKYLEFITALTSKTPAAAASGNPNLKPKLFIVSVTGPVDDVAECYTRVADAARALHVPLAVEVNLSCPNIPGAPPPAYDGDALRRYLNALAARAGGHADPVPWGVKTPPYTHAAQFEMLGATLRGEGGECCPVSFITATNTLGSCLVLEPRGGNSASEEGKGNGNVPKLAGNTYGIGGMAGAPLHPLALGNVATLRRMLDAAPETRHVRIIGVGGVEDADGYRRMRDVGAYAVGVGTALGRKGVGVFKEIEDGLREGGEVIW